MSKQQTQQAAAFDAQFDYMVDAADDVNRDWLWRFTQGVIGRLQPELEQDAARYREVRLGRYWSVISGDGEELRLEALDSDIDAAMAVQKGGE